MHSPNSSGSFLGSPVSSGSAVILQKFDLKNKELKRITEELTSELLGSQNENRLLKQRIESLLKVQEENTKFQNQVKMMNDKNDILLKDKKIVEERVDYLLSRLGQTDSSSEGAERNTLAKLDEISILIDHQLAQNGDVTSLLRNAEHLNEVYKQDLVKKETEMKKLVEEHDKRVHEMQEKYEREMESIEQRGTDLTNLFEEEKEKLASRMEELKEEFEATESKLMSDIEALKATVNEQSSLIQEFEANNSELNNRLIETEDRARVREAELLADIESMNQNTENLMNEIVLLQQAIEEQTTDADSEIIKLKDLIETRDENSF